MAIKFALPQRTILLCDYDLGGFRAPEMVKRRPVVVLTPRLPHRDNLLTVVPLSGTETKPPRAYHPKIDLGFELPHPFPAQVWWAKADMAASVSLERLDLFRTERDQDGKRKYLSNLKVPEDQFVLIQAAVKLAFGLN